MNCEKCGAKLREGARFCPKCGSEIAVAQTKTGIKSNKVICLLIISVALTVIAVVTVLFAGRERNAKSEDSSDGVNVYSEREDTVNEKAIDDTEESLEEEMMSEQTGEDTDDLIMSEPAEVYRVLDDNVADYNSTQLLDYRLYNRYEGQDKYMYGYPASLFNSYYESDEIKPGECYGTRIHQNAYSASDDSYVCFNMYERTDSFSISDMGMYTYNYEAQYLTDPQPVINGLSSDEQCYMSILVGFTDETRNTSVYNLVRTEGEYIYQMKIYYPTPGDIESKKHTDYYIDCMYRLCEFSNHQSSPRSYEEYIESID